MLARSSILRHPSGVTLETPLLVPAFSSKGFRINGEGLSEVTEALRTSTEFLTETLLVSAYDIYYGRITDEYQDLTDSVFIDSGGYETEDDHDMSAVFRHSCPVEHWDRELLNSVLGDWPLEVPAVFVNFDHGSHRISLAEQIDSAREFFAGYPNHLHDIILKPETRDQRYLPLESLLSLASRLNEFHIIGVTEKELGNSLLERMYRIAKLRMALDEEGISSPIHVFGSLDPVTSPLYFLSGAEIFDGLTWLRFSYYHGIASYDCNYGALIVGIHERDNLVKAKALADNIYYLRSLKYQMKDFLLDEDYSKFEFHSELLNNSYDRLRSKLRGRL